MELPTRYEPQTTESAIYQRWLDAGCFRATPGTPGDGKAYSVAIPPPNVTGALHLGHALNNTTIDSLGRWKRMLGFHVVILPGTDHAGIATQAVVERRLQQDEGKSRHDLGRDAFLSRVWQWKEEYNERIVGQFKQLGCAYDWDRLCFTMDPNYVDAIQTVFGKWFDDGHIYLGERIVNWSPPLMTVISDIEIDEREEDGSLWHLRYPLADGSGELIVATTRPETMLGDTAVAVHPDDGRYQHLIGKTLRLPIVGREIPIVADDFVKAEFGSGAVKVTPFHDPNDYEIGLRHDLPRIEVIGPDAKMTENAGAYAGLDRFDARKRIVADLDAARFLVKVEPYRHMVPHCDRSGAVVEPRVSRQWFCKMAGTPMVEGAIDAARNGDIQFLPERYRDIYLRWMEKLRDWPISRSLWWGHRLPVWRNQGADPQEFASWVFARTADEAATKLATTPDLVAQSDDVLDTWFSSALWPFATLGWPQTTEKARADLAYWYPTSLLSTAQEILYLWVARMIMTGESFLGKKPFDDVYIHATILDEHGRRMSKSKGNGIDPVDLIALYGADALRFTLLRDAGQRQDIRVKPLRFFDEHGKEIQVPREMYRKDWQATGDGKFLLNFESLPTAGQRKSSTAIATQFQHEQVEQARNFCNKIWNASRFVLLSLGENFSPSPSEERTDGGGGRGVGATLADRWILSRLSATVDAVNAGFSTYDMDDAARALYEFVWDDFCDWYIEAAKPRLQAGDESVRRVLWFTLERTLRLMHPILPHLSEAIWQSLPGAEEAAGVEFLMQAAFPENLGLRDETAEAEWAIVQETTGTIRNLQASNSLKKNGPAFVAPSSETVRAVLSANAPLIESLTRFAPLTLSAGPPDGFLQPTRFGDISLPRPEASEGDLAAEKARIVLELARIEKDFAGLDARLSNPSFADRAPADVVEKARAQHAELLDKRGKLTERLEALG